jgi:hypothetical protein
VCAATVGESVQLRLYGTDVELESLQMAGVACSPEY